MDWSSFTIGLVVGAAGIVVTGFFRELGKDLYGAVKRKLLPLPPEDVQVAAGFEPDLYEPGGCSWINSLKALDKEQDGYSYYPHPSNGGRCYRKPNPGRDESVEYLMIKPDAVKKGSAA
ncbi:MAG: hypothetical protein D6815_01195 [Candidatus Dadabacteria bacterium]|nr:MAG: hypothetical protein D6815_01195 [Candidatus Dadabacteria bacterium]